MRTDLNTEAPAVALADIGDAGQVVAVRSRPLVMDAPAVPAVPDWARPLVRPPTVRWPEKQRSFLLELVAAGGATGRYGPCSATTIQLIHDQLAPTLLGLPAVGYRRFARPVVLGRHRGGSHFRLAVSAVELAGVDLASRTAGVPLSTLLGGATRCTVPAYATALGLDIDHPLAPDLARWLVEAGWYGQKWRLPGFDQAEEPVADIRRLARVRSAVGPDVRVMIDAVGRWSMDYTRRILPALAELSVAWLEEPLAPDRIGELRHLPRLATPIAAGEHRYDSVDQYRLLTSGAVDVWQPDVGWCGGLQQALCGVEFASTHGIRTYPHGGCLPGALALAGLTDPADVPAVEYHLTQEPRRQQAVTEPASVRDGELAVREEPGLTGAYRTEPGHVDTLAEVSDGVR